MNRFIAFSGQGQSLRKKGRKPWITWNGYSAYVTPSTAKFKKTKKKQNTDLKKLSPLCVLYLNSIIFQKRALIVRLLLKHAALVLGYNLYSQGHLIEPASTGNISIINSFRIITGIMSCFLSVHHLPELFFDQILHLKYTVSRIPIVVQTVGPITLF